KGVRQMAATAKTVPASVLLAMLLGVSTADGASLGPWTVQSPMNEARTGPALAAVGDFVYAIGGAHDYFSAALNSVEVAHVNQDGSLDIWSTTPPLLSARYNVSAVGVRDKLYVTGGWGIGIATTEIGAVNLDGTVSGWTYGPNL